MVARGDSNCISDDQLLERFVTRRDEAAFELLVWRHGKMVLGVCQRLLHDSHAAEDAFQASFLVLARRSRSIRKRASVGGWLYKVAYRTALQERARTIKRMRQESPLQDEFTTEARTDPVIEAEQRELRSVIDEEVSHLPEKYRVPFVLCCVEGRSNQEAARELGCPVGTVESRLSRARERLRTRLSRRGIVSSSGPAIAALSRSDALTSVPTRLVMSTASIANRVAAGQIAGAVSAPVAALTEGVLKAMYMTKLRIIGVLLTVGVLGAGAGLSSHLSKGEKALANDKDNPALAQAERKIAFEQAPAAGAPNQDGQPVPRPLPETVEFFPAALGYAWAIVPKRFGVGTGFALSWRPPPQPWLPAEAGIAIMLDKDKDGGLVIMITHPDSTDRAGLPDYRPVALDAQQRGYPLKVTSGVGYWNTMMERYYLDPRILPAEKVTHVGIEVLTPEGPKLLRKRAAERAQKAGVEVLSFPEIGKAYDFTLTAMDGKKIRSRDLRGKVVLITCWSTWNLQCMDLLRQTKELYEKRHQDGLEVIGINVDHDSGKAKNACKSLQLAWPQVIVPSEEEKRQLWEEASGGIVVPRVLVIDREGILRVNRGDDQLDRDAIAKLLEKPPTDPK
jgi:RNA polymerase sigma factor (sigma-70 family)